MGGILDNRVVQELLAGTVGGCTGILVSQPFDVIKVRLQSTVVTAAADPTRRLSVLGELMHGVRTEGAVALYRGVGPPLVANGILNAVLFSAYGAGLRMLGTAEGATPTGQAAFLAGSYGGLWTSAISVPTELVKVRQQVEVGRTQTSSLRIIRGIVAEKGWGGVFRGGVATVARDAWSFGVYFWTYSAMKSVLLEALGGGGGGGDGSDGGPVAEARGIRHEVGEAAAVCLSGAGAGVIAWTVCYPIDSVKTIIQTEAHVAINSPATEWFRLLMATSRDRLWRGYSACVARSIPLNGVTFFVYEYSLKMMRDNTPAALS
jgi:solute carrier family 25 carnitine/acylcarnitine transporter 20/29